MTHILPCAFCNEEAIFTLMLEDEECDVGFIQCSNVDCVLNYAPQPRDEMVEAWNRRA